MAVKHKSHKTEFFIHKLEDIDNLPPEIPDEVKTFIKSTLKKISSGEKTPEELFNSIQPPLLNNDLNFDDIPDDDLEDDSSETWKKNIRKNMRW